MKNPEVSVVMPAYNHEKFVGEAIESVLNQTFADFEFIIINDGSKDGTDAVIKRYDDPRIKYHSQENQGAHNAINKGISIAKGEYISIINSDDVYHPERLSFLLEQAKSRDAVFIFTDLVYINEFGERLREKSPRYDNIRSIYTTSNSLEETFLSGNIAITTSNFFFLSGILKEIESFKPYRYVHDYDFALRVLLKYPDNLLYIADKTYLSYRMHGANTILESTTASIKETINMLLQNAPDFMQSEKDRAHAEVTLRQIVTLVNDINALENSMSWKITTPLRWGYDIYLQLMKSLTE